MLLLFLWVLEPPMTVSLGQWLLSRQSTVNFLSKNYKSYYDLGNILLQMKKNPFGSKIAKCIPKHIFYSSKVVF